MYSEDDTDTVFDCEMQATKNGNLAKRSRYYQGMIDLNLIERGADYRKLKKSYVIFICPFDFFGEGLHKYTFENLCKERPQLGLGDEATKIFLCAGGDADDVSEEMKDFLEWLTGKEGKSILVQNLENAVKAVKNKEEWRLEYMTLLMRDQEMMQKGREEGREQGRIDTLITFLENGGTVSEAKKMLAVSDEDIRIAESRRSAMSPSQKNSKV